MAQSKNQMTRAQRGVIALCAVGVSVSGAVFAAPMAHAQGGHCDLLTPKGEKVPYSCSALFGVNYSVQGEKGVPGLVLPGKPYDVTKSSYIKPIPPGLVMPPGLTFSSAESSYEILDNKTRLDFVGSDGSKSKDQRVGADGEVQGEARISKKVENNGEPIGEVAIPREARNEVGTHGVRIKVTYADNSSNESRVDIQAIDSGAAMHEMSMYDTTSGDVNGDDIENTTDEGDRSSVTRLNLMIGQQRTLYVRNEKTRDPECGDLIGGESGVLSEINTVCDDKDDPPERIFITDEYGQVLDEQGENSEESIGVNWARMEKFQHEGQNSYRVRFYPGQAQLDGGGMKKNILYLTSQYADGSWRTNRLEVTVRPHENLPQTLVLPPTVMRAWEVKQVDLQGNTPAGHGTLTFNSSEQNPEWMTVNRYSGKVTYKPQRAAVAIKTYPVTVHVTAESGASMQITSTVQIKPQRDVDDSRVRTEDNGGGASDSNNPGTENQEKGFFGKFWSALTSFSFG